MHARLKGTALALLLASPVPLRAEQPASAAAHAFEQLSGLVGAWESRVGDGPPHSVEYRLSANGSVLVETWALGPGRESMTLYHLEGDRLLATHYCVQGNQPRLQLVKSTANEFYFEFRDGTNIHVAGGEHQHAFWLKLTGRDSFARSETYIRNDSAPDEVGVAGEAVTYTRRPAPGH